jgi:hypothetical protein
MTNEYVMKEKIRKIANSDTETFVCMTIDHSPQELIKNNCDELIPNPIFKYSIGYSNSNFIFLVKKSSKSLSCMDIQLHFLKIFISKIMSLP